MQRLGFRVASDRITASSMRSGCSVTVNAVLLHLILRLQLDECSAVIVHHNLSLFP